MFSQLRSVKWRVSIPDMNTGLRLRNFSGSREMGPVLARCLSNFAFKDHAEILGVFKSGQACDLR